MDDDNPSGGRYPKKIPYASVEGPTGKVSYSRYVCTRFLNLSPKKYHRKEPLLEYFLRSYFAVLFFISKIGPTKNKENNLIKQILQNYNKQI